MLPVIFVTIKDSLSQIINHLYNNHFYGILSKYNIHVAGTKLVPALSFNRSLKLYKIIKGKNIIIMGVAKASLDASVRYLASSLGKHNIRPIRILLAKGVGGFKSTLKQIEEHAPLRRNVTQDEFSNAALFLFSDLASGVIGENIHVDSGYPILG